MEDNIDVNTENISTSESEPVSTIDGETLPPLSQELYVSVLDTTETNEKCNLKKKGISKIPSKTERIPLDIYLADLRKNACDQPSVELDEVESTQSLETDSCEWPIEIQNLKKETKKKINFTVIRDLFVRISKHSSPTRFIKMRNNLRRPFIIIEDDIDYTPKRAILPDDPRWIADPMLLNYPTTLSAEIKPNDFLITGRKPSLLGSNLDSSSYKMITKIDSSSIATNYDELASSKAPSMFPYKSEEREIVNRNRIVFKLKETNTISILYMISKATSIDEEEGQAITINNELHKTVHQRLRKSSDNYCQTSKEGRDRIKETQLSCKLRFNKYAFVSNWDRYDSIRETICEVVEPSAQQLQVVGKVDKIVYSEEKWICEPIIGKNFIIKNRLNWLEMAMITERLLLSNNAMKRQILFHDLLKSDPLSNNLEFKYNLLRLWTLKTDKTEGMAVTSLSWNKHKKNILAAGYGKYDFNDKDTGVVCIWNSKNLAHPERQYTFEYSVTSLKFCDLYPDILAISFYCGWVILINITQEETVKVIARNMPHLETSVSPVWDIAWKKKFSDKSGDHSEHIVECRGDGFVYEYIKERLFEKKPIMRISKMKGKIRGINCPRKCQPYVIPLVRNPAILCITIHPVDICIYYLGSDEGGVYKCSTQDIHQPLDIFLAHNGPVYTIQFHPACSKIFLTCGADWCVRVWGEGIITPLLTLSSGASSVQFANWCPNQPTLIVTITATRIELWDISRRIFHPQMVCENPKDTLNTFLTFTRNGESLCVGDKAGNIHFYILSNIPFTPSNSDMVLALILIKALTPNRKLLHELYKLGAPFNVSRIYKNYLNLS